MVDELKKQMRTFEHLIGFHGKLDVTSRDSMKELINALTSKYKSDVKSSIHLHRLEFFHDLIQSSRRRKECSATSDQVKEEEQKEKSEQKEEKEEEAAAEGGGAEDKLPDEVVKVEAKDVDEWKDLMTLSKIYYVLEHPRSEGLTWKRRIAKKKTIDTFGDMDMIEWRVAQNFRLRGLQEWAQSRSDARKMVEQSGVEFDESEDTKEFEELCKLFDPSKPPPKSSIHKTESEKPAGEKKSSAERPFKYYDECMEDWTESYSEDSEYSDVELPGEEIEDFPDETEAKITGFPATRKASLDQEENISEILSNYQEFSPYRDPVFEQMDKAEIIEEWFELYHKSCIAGPEEQIVKKPKADFARDDKLNMIAEEEEPEEDVQTKTPTGIDADEALPTSSETGEEAKEVAETRVQDTPAKGTDEGSKEGDDDGISENAKEEVLKMSAVPEEPEATEVSQEEDAEETTESTEENTSEINETPSEQRSVDVDSPETTEENEPETVEDSKDGDED